MSMSPNLLAFNMFASEMRLVLRDATLLSRAEMQMGIEKVIGNRWKAMTPEEKEKHIDKARVEQARLIAEGGMPTVSSNGVRGKKQKATGSTGSDAAPKRRRGRPPKAETSVPFARKSVAPGNMFASSHGFIRSDFLDVNHHDGHDERDPYGGLSYNDHHNLSDLFLPFNPSSLPVVVNPHPDQVYQEKNSGHDQSYDPTSFLHHISVMDQDGLKPSHPPGSADLTGTKVEGFIDGTFDTGYFMTVRVNGQTLRGMLYREDACMRAVGEHARQGSVS